MDTCEQLSERRRVGASDGDVQGVLGCANDSGLWLPYNNRNPLCILQAKPIRRDMRWSTLSTGQIMLPECPLVCVLRYIPAMLVGT